MALNRYEAITSSGAKTSSGVITTANTPGVLYGVTLRSGTSASSVSLRNGGASGTILWTLSNVATTAAGDTTIIQNFTEPIDFSTDIYLSIAGTGAEAFVAYKQLV